jgi:hypothetical protein
LPIPSSGIFKENPDWLAKVDFIYSNSFDHSYDPEKCLNTWIDSLRIGGLCILDTVTDMHLRSQ